MTGPMRPVAVKATPIDPWRPIPPPPQTLICRTCGETLDLVHTATLFGIPNYEHRDKPVAAAG